MSHVTSYTCMRYGTTAWEDICHVVYIHGHWHTNECVMSHMCTRHVTHTAIHCNTLQHTATRCSTLQHTAALCNTLQHAKMNCNCSTLQQTAARCNTLQHIANTLQHIATLCNNYHRVISHLYACQRTHMKADYYTLQHTATHCNTLQHSATHCNTLQHAATHCNTPQHFWSNHVIFVHRFPHIFECRIRILQTNEPHTCMSLFNQLWVMSNKRISSVYLCVWVLGFFLVLFTQLC